jgi:hypothetical protein
MTEVEKLNQEWWAAQSEYKRAVQGAGLEAIFAELRER